MTQVSFWFREKDDLRSYRDLHYKEIGELGAESWHAGYYYKIYEMPNVDNKGNSAYIKITRTRKMRLGGEDIVYEPDMYEDEQDLYEEAFERTGGNSDLSTIISKQDFAKRCIFNNAGGIGRELYKRSRQEIFKDLYNDRLYDIEDEYGKDSQEVEKFKKALEGVSCLDSQRVLDSGYTEFAVDKKQNEDVLFSESVLKELKVDSDFIKESMWSRIKKGLLTPPSNKEVEAISENGSYITEDICVLEGSHISGNSAAESDSVTIFTF